MESAPSLLELVTALSAQVSQLQTYLDSSKKPNPSLQLGAEPTLVLPPHLDRVRQEALNACDELRAVLQGPLPHLMSLVTKVSLVLAEAMFRNTVTNNEMFVSSKTISRPYKLSAGSA